jgi:hypothetical protein
MQTNLAVNFRWSSNRLMFDCSYDKGKTQIGMAKFQALKGFGEISTPARG